MRVSRWVVILEIVQDEARDRWKRCLSSLNTMGYVSSFKIRHKFPDHTLMSVSILTNQKAKRARDARIAHYKDLETNYKLAVEAVYF